MHPMAKMAKIARGLAIKIGCQKWSLGEWRFGEIGDFGKNGKFGWQKIARGLAIEVRW